MRESGFTEVRWYHGQIVRPKLTEFSVSLGLFYAMTIGDCETHREHSIVMYWIVQQ